MEYRLYEWRHGAVWSDGSYIVVPADEGVRVPNVVAFAD